MTVGNSAGLNFSGGLFMGNNNSQLSRVTSGSKAEYQAGFTLPEMVVVISIVGLLVLFATTRVSALTGSFKRHEVRQ